MAIQHIYGAKVTPNFKAPTVEYTATVNRLNSNSVGIFSQVDFRPLGSSEIEFSISFHHPFDYEITQDNWAMFLKYQIHTRPQRDADKRSVGGKRLQHQEISSKSSLGPLFFLAQTPVTNTAILVIDDNINDDMVPGFKIPHAVQVFDHSLGFKIKSFSARFDHRGIGITPWFGADNTVPYSGRTYYLPLKEELTPDHYLFLYLKGEKDFKFDQQMFDCYWDPDSGIQDSHRLFLKNINSFYYLESFDGKVKISVTDDAANHILAGLMSIMDKVVLEKFGEDMRRALLLGNDLAIIKGCFNLREDIIRFQQSQRNQ